MSMLSRYLPYFDIFGQPIELILNSNNKYRTMLGGINSLLLLLCFTVIVAQSILGLFSRTQFNVTQQDIYNESPIIDTALLQGFMLGVQVLDRQSKAKLRIPLQFSLMYKSCTANDCYDFSIDLRPCKEHDFPESSLQVEEYHCLPDNRLSTGHTSFRMVVQPLACAEDTIKQSCRESIDYLLNSQLELGLLITDVKLNPFAAQMLAPFINQYYRYSFNGFVEQPNCDIYLKQSRIEEDRSLLPFFNDIRITELLSISSSESRNQNHLISNTTNLAVIEIIPSWQRVLVTKSYLHIDQMMAYLGGLMKLVIFIFSIPLVFYNRFSLYVFLANNLYTFNVPLSKDYLRKLNDGQFSVQQGFSYDVITSKIKDRIHRAQIVVRGIKDGTMKLLGTESPQMTKHKHKHEDIIPRDRRKAVIGDEIITPEQFDRKYFLDGTFQDLLSQDTGIKMAFWYLISLIFCKKLFFKSNIQLQLIDRAVEMIQTDVDILVIMDRMHEIDKLKKLLLTDTQIKVFDYMPKPVIRAEKLEQGRKTIKFKSEKSVVPASSTWIARPKGQTTFDERVMRQASMIHDRKLKFDSKEAFQQLYKSYHDLSKEIHQPNNREGSRMNLKLMDLLGHQLIEIFETSQLLYDPQEQYLENYNNYLTNDRYIERKLNFLHSNQDYLVSAMHNQSFSSVRESNTIPIKPRKLKSQFYDKCQDDNEIQDEVEHEDEDQHGPLNYDEQEIQEEFNPPSGMEPSPILRVKDHQLSHDTLNSGRIMSAYPESNGLLEEDVCLRIQSHNLKVNSNLK